MKIRLSDITERPCDKYRDHIISKYGLHGEFDPAEVFDTVPDGASYQDVIWLLHYCAKAWTPETLELLKSMNPSSWAISKMITYNSYVQTVEMLEYLMSLKPTQYVIDELIRMCDFARENKHLLT